MTDTDEDWELNMAWRDVLQAIHNGRIVLNNFSRKEIESHEELDKLNIDHHDIADILQYLVETNLLEKHIQNVDLNNVPEKHQPTHIHYTISERGFQVLFEEHTTRKQGRTQTGLVVLTVILIIANIVAQIPNGTARIWLGVAVLVGLFIFIWQDIIPLPYLDKH